MSREGLYRSRVGMLPAGSGTGLKAEVLWILLPIGFLLLVFWAAWQGLYLHWRYSSGALPGMMAVAAALLFWIRRMLQDSRKKPEADGRLLSLAALGALGYALGYAWLPGLLSRELALLSSALLLLALLPPEQRPYSWALAPLLMLAPPLEPSLNFFLGYPLRRLVAACAAGLFPGKLFLDGVGLSDGVTTVFVDAPCSGVRMLGSAALLASLAAALLRLRLLSVLLALTWAGCMAIVANIVRALTLFVLMRSGEVSDSMHSLIGVISFGGGGACHPGGLPLAGAAFSGAVRSASLHAPYLCAAFPLGQRADDGACALWGVRRGSADDGGEGGAGLPGGISTH